jgi:hypothetical protein
VNGFGETPLCLAVRHGLAVSDFLHGVTPLALAEALLEAGASPLAVADGRGLPLEVGILDPALLELLNRWSRWWRRRVLAWIRSRGHGHPLCSLMPELLVNVSQFL